MGSRDSDVKAGINLSLPAGVQHCRELRAQNLPATVDGWKSQELAATPGILGHRSCAASERATVLKEGQMVGSAYQCNAPTVRACCDSTLLSRTTWPVTSLRSPRR